jgi:quercetin dioxygenase-like cupin family protein
MRYVFKMGETKRYRFPTHTNELIMDRSEAAASEVFITVLEPGEAPPLHKHDDTEQVFFILSGRGRLEISQELEAHPVIPGDVVRIPPSTFHRIYCVGDEPLRYLAIDCFPSGRPEAEPTWDSHVRVVCSEQGWGYDDIVGR